jgi:hypothetical protein
MGAITVPGRRTTGNGRMKGQWKSRLRTSCGGGRLITRAGYSTAPLRFRLLSSHTRRKVKRLTSAHAGQAVDAFPGIPGGRWPHGASR